MSKSDTKNVKLGVCHVYYDGEDLGYTKGGVEVNVSTETHKVEVDQFGKTVVSENIMGRNVTVKVPLAETTLDNMVKIMPGATLVENGGAVASGTITIATNPANGETITVNGKTVTFKTVAATDFDVEIGATKSDTAAELAAVLSANTDPAFGGFNFVAAADVVTVTATQKGTDGNAFTLATGTAGVKVTMSGATLAGGAEPTSKKVVVTNGVGVNLIDIAKELRLHPKGKPLSDKSDDFVIPKAATAGALTFAYKVDEERVYNCEFSGYPDVTQGDTLFTVGDDSV